MLLNEGTYGHIYDLKNGTVRKQYKNDVNGIPADMIREIATLKRVDSPYVIQLLNVGENFIILPFYSYNLNQVFKYKVPYNKKNIFKCICLGLYDLHSIGILHSDIKPGNIMVKDENRAVLIDTGFSKVFEANRHFDIRSPKVATLYYRAPEIITGEKYSFEIDIWSAGCILAEMYTGSCLFKIDNETDLLEYQYYLMGTPTYHTDFELDFEPGVYREDFKKYEIVELIGGMLNTDYKERWNISKVLNSDYFAEHLPFQNVLENYQEYLDDYDVDFVLNVSEKLMEMRKILYLWLISIINFYNLSDSTYFRTVMLVDRMLIGGKMDINEENFQLIGLACIFLAGKYEMIDGLSINEILSVSDYSRTELLEMEKIVFEKLNYDICQPTLYNYLCLYIHDLSMSKKHVIQLLKYFYVCSVDNCYLWPYPILSIVASYIILGKNIDIENVTEDERDDLFICDRTIRSWLLRLTEEDYKPILEKFA